MAASETTDGSITELALSGIAAADAICQRLAQASTFLPAGAKADPWRAWLSDSSVSPSTTFVQSTVEYRSTDETVISSSYADLITNGPNALSGGVRLDQNGSTLPLGATAHTATQLNGTVDASGRHCLDWASNDIGDETLRGNVVATGLAWTFAAVFTCDLLFNLYCVQQGPAGLPVSLQSFEIE